jgi:RNA polymerase sigma-70 factor (ECF subfamily)
MGDASQPPTSPTLLGQLRQDPTNQQAWRRFVELYGPQIYAWCRKWGLQEADNQDVTQNVLLRLSEKMRTFSYDPARSFRGWLKTLTQHALSDFLEGRPRAGVGSGDTNVLAALQAVEARADLAKHLEEVFDTELLQEATVRVRLRVAPRTWDAFRLTALEGLSGAAAAAQLGMKVATVFVAKSEVLRMLREETARLEGPGPE